MRREKRIKIRLSEDELTDLHIIAERQHTSVASLLRDSTLYDVKHVFVNMKDLQGLTTVISAIDTEVSHFIITMQKKHDIYRADILKIINETEGIDREYGTLRREILGKRNKIMRLVETGLKSEEVIYTEPPVLDKATTITLTEEEYEKAKKLAEKSGQSLSCFLKANAFEKAAKTYIVNTDNVDELCNQLRKNLRFLKAVYDDVKDRYIDADDSDNISKILRDIRVEILKKKVQTDIKTIRSEAKKIKEGGTSWQL